MPPDFEFPLPWGLYDTWLDRQVVLADVAAKDNWDTLTSGSVVVQPSERLKAAGNFVLNEIGYLSGGVFHLVEHAAGDLLGLVGQGIEAVERVAPGFKTTLESLQGVPALGPEFGLLARGALLQARVFTAESLMAARLSVIELAATRTTAQGVTVFDSLSPAWVETFARAERHVLHVTTSEGVSFWAVSGAGGQLGHTEYAAALYLREAQLLYPGQQLLMQGYLASCRCAAINCQTLLDFLARRVV